jgi:hypothetical protein
MIPLKGSNTIDDATRKGRLLSTLVRYQPYFQGIKNQRFILRKKTSGTTNMFQGIKINVSFFLFITNRGKKSKWGLHVTIAPKTFVLVLAWYRVDKT